MGNSAQLIQVFEIRGGNLKKAGDVSIKVKEILKSVGFPAEVIRRAAIACFEAEMNVVMYAKRATLRLSLSPELIEVAVDDEGNGIEDIELAMKEGFSTATPEQREMGFGAGMGLPNIARNTDSMKITSLLGTGTLLKFAINV